MPAALDDCLSYGVLANVLIGKVISSETVLLAAILRLFVNQTCEFVLNFISSVMPRNI